MNRNYELMFIVRPDMVDEDLNKLISTLESSVTSAGGTAKSEVWGKRRLAYRVGRFNDGIFVLMMIEAAGATVHEVERRLRVTEPVIKFLSVRTDEELKRLDKIKKIRDSKKKASAQPAPPPLRLHQQHRKPPRKHRPRRRFSWKFGSAYRFGDTTSGAKARVSWGVAASATGGSEAGPSQNRILRKQEHYGRRNKGTEPRSGGESRPERTGGDRPERGGPRGPRPGGGPGGPREGGRKFFRRKKVCKFCVEKIEAVNYKDVRLLAQFVAESGKITPRRLTGVCTPHQRRLSRAIKQARNIALLPFAGRAQ